MVSFIVIGRNEGAHLKKCLDSIYSSIGRTNLKEHEIIYVDSNSSDNSIEIAKNYNNIKIYSISVDFNAAAARNIGAKESSGDILFFIDADMELYPEFLSEVLDNRQQLKFNLVTGQLVDVIDGFQEKVRPITVKKALSGGIFLIRKNIWELMNGMRTKFTTGEDPELGLRLIKKGYTLHRKDKFIARHNTIPYLDRSRIWKMVWNKEKFYSRCVLYRDHVFNKHMYYQLWTNDKTFIILVSIFMTWPLASSTINLICFIVYFTAIAIRCKKQLKHLPFIELYSYYIIVDILNLIYLFTFFPKNKRLNYSRIS